MGSVSGKHKNYPSAFTFCLAASFLAVSPAVAATYPLNNTTSALSGDTIAVLSPADTLTTAQTLPSSLTFLAPGSTTITIGTPTSGFTSGAAGNTSLTLTGGSFTFTGANLTAGSGGVFSFSNPSSGFVITPDAGSMTTFSNNHATGSGGVISSVHNVTIDGNTTFLNNTAGGNGGGIYVNPAVGNPGNIVINGTLTASGNHVNGSGGVIETGANAAVSVTFGTPGGTSILSNNIAQGSGGAIIINQGDLTVYGNLIADDNHAAPVSGSAGAGGALQVPYGNITIDGNAVLTNNTATAWGGVARAGKDITITGGLTLADNYISSLYVPSTPPTLGTTNPDFLYSSGGGLIAVGTVTVSGPIAITNNSALSNGGGVIAGKIAFFPTGSVTISDNHADGSGGGLLANSTVTIIGDGAGVTFANNTAGGSPQGTVANASAMPPGRGGGAIFARYGDVYIQDGDVSLTNNTAGGNGGGIWAQNGTVSVIGGSLTADGNQALGNATTGSLGDGGTIDGMNVNVTGDVSLTNNTATGNGGGIYTEGVDSGGVSGGDAPVKSNEISSTTIGGNLVAANNTAGIDGGAIDSGDVSIGGSATLTNNTAQTGNGGAIEAETNVAIGGSLTASGNAAPLGQGGAIYIEEPGSLTVNGDVTLSSNKATAGGAVQVLDGNVSVGGNLIANGNQATTGNGGAISAEAGNVTVAGNVTATGNTAATDGGVIDGGNVSINGNVDATNNTATTGNGGAISGENNVTVAGAVTVSGNKAGGSGGAIAAEDGDVNVGTVTASNNTAGGQGGAIYAENSATVNSVGNSTFTNNTAGGQGGAIYVDDSTLTLNSQGGNITFSGNMENAATTPQANAVYLNNDGGSGGLTMNTPAGTVITFYDPIASNPANGLVTVTKNGPGIVSFDGSKYPNDPTNQTSQIYANTQVNEGTFEVARGAIYGVRGVDIGMPADSFTTAVGTILQGGVNGTVAADNVQINGDLNIAGRYGAGNSNNIFTIHSATTNFGGGTIFFNTVLNNGGSVGGLPGSPANSDLLVLDGGAATGAAFISVRKIGGAGELTTGDGILLVQTVNGATTAPGMFTLTNGAIPIRMISGAYEYDLYRNGVGANTAANGDWYLRSIYAPNPPGNGPENPSPIPENPSLIPGKPSPRPETALYTRNMAAANSMFIHTLHDRLGEPQYTEAYGGKNQVYGDKSKGENNNVPAVWARVVGSRTDTEAGGGAIDTKTDTGLVHMGGDIAHWTDGNSRYLLGVMGAYGKSTTDAESKDVPFTNNGLARKASGDVKGYGLGLYGTWYGNDNDKYPRGPYVDVWGMFNRFNNTLQGNVLPQETYISQGGIVSAEGGWAFVARDDGKRQWMLEPQAQVAYVIFNQDTHKEVIGTVVDGDDGSGFIARLGARMYYRSTQHDNGWQPFFEANIWHYGMNNSLDFNGTTISDGAPSARYEFKAGVQAELAQGWQVYAHLGGQWGLDGYDRYEGMLGLKYLW